MQFVEQRTRITTIQSAKADRPSEDTFFTSANADRVIALVADGAPQRVRTTHNMRPLLDRYGEGTTPGRCAALITRDVISQKLNTGLSVSLTDAVLAANEHLHAGLAAIYGALTADAVYQHEPELHFLLDDPRLLRLILPVCCVTTVRVDVQAGVLEYAHGGDTALFLFYRDGRVVRATRDQMIQHDGRAVQAAQMIQAETGAAHLADVVTDERVREINIANGIYHNYEDESGTTDAAVGVGVINGLPSLAAYLETGSVPTSDLSGFLVCSDGFPPHSPLSVAADGEASLIQSMHETIEAKGLAGYFAELRAAEYADAGLDAYPRLGSTTTRQRSTLNLCKDLRQIH
jgi:hypothetical protein